MIDMDYLRQWLGRESIEQDVASAAPIDGLAALLDHDRSHWHQGEVPPLGHWLYFLPRARQSDISPDGHPNRGGWMPPVPLPRRMWASGSIVFHAPIMIGERIERRSTVAAIDAKKGASGDLIFVTLEHRISNADGQLCIAEKQHIVYRGAAATAASPASTASEPILADPEALSRTIRPDPVMLFRYSALTFNAHRIHYDRDYARTEECYPGLVVHGPLSATLLADHFLRETPGSGIATLDFRAERPLFDDAPMTLNLRRDNGKDRLWTAGPDGHPAMKVGITPQYARNDQGE